MQSAAVKAMWIGPATMAGAMLLAGLVGCGKTRTSDADIEVMREPALMKLLDEDGAGLVLVDVRRPEAYASGYLPGAINIPVSKLERHANDPRLMAARRIVVYGQGWSDPLSRVGVKKLLAMGFKDVYDFKGGVELWQDTGHPLSRSLDARFARPESR